jgi:hypothetical protein
MATMSSSNESNNRGIWKKISPIDVWMIVSTTMLLVAYLSIRTRISNYMYVARWIADFAKSFLGG